LVTGLGDGDTVPTNTENHFRPEPRGQPQARLSPTGISIQLPHELRSAPWRGLLGVNVFLLRDCQDLWIGCARWSRGGFLILLVGSFVEHSFLEDSSGADEGDEVGAVDRRHRCSADRMSLNAIATPAARNPAPLVTRVRNRTVENVDSMGLVVFRWIRCSAEKS
jgi:hypothetical protein